MQKSFDVICCLHKMKQSHWLLCVAKNCDWSRKITPLKNSFFLSERSYVIWVLLPEIHDFFLCLILIRAIVTGRMLFLHQWKSWVYYMRNKNILLQFVRTELSSSKKWARNTYVFPVLPLRIRDIRVREGTFIDWICRKNCACNFHPFHFPIQIKNPIPSYFLFEILMTTACQNPVKYFINVYLPIAKPVFCKQISYF